VSDLDRLKQLLLADEREMLERAEQRLAALELHQRDLSISLPALVNAAPREPMAGALASPVAAALGSAVRNNSGSIVDALFPVIGPIIRKAIAEALRGLMSDLNSVLEQSFTARGLKWRIEAWRSGVPYAQVVLKHSLRYRIDHVFLIERDSGLVLHRESSPGLPDLDADAIAGMLTAIGQFVRDSVGREGGDSLEAARVGEYLLWVLDGPRASIASFIHGVPPEALRGVLTQRLEQIHARLADPLRERDADTTEDAVAWHAALDPIDLVRAAAPSQDAAASTPSRWPALLVLLLALAALAWYHARNERWQSRVNTLQQTLAGHPGFLLTSIESKPWRSLALSGLLDPDAEPIAPVLENLDLGGVQPTLHLDGYLSTDDAMLAKRAQRLLDPPADVQLVVNKGVLELRGAASEAWIVRTREHAAWVAGLRGVEFNVSEISDRAQAAHAVLATLARDVAAIKVLFVRDVEPAADAAQRVAEIAVILVRAQALAEQAGLPVHLRIEGCNDAPGGNEINATLRTERARWLGDALLAHGVSAQLLQNSITRESASVGTMQFRGAQVRLLLGADEQ
jgi:hypothetical protein